MKPLIERLGHSYVANLKKSKMAASKKKLWQNHDVYIENQIIFANILYKNQWYRNKDRCGYKRFVLCVSEILLSFLKLLEQYHKRYI